MAPLVVLVLITAAVGVALVEAARRRRRWKARLTMDVAGLRAELARLDAESGRLFGTRGLDEDRAETRILCAQRLLDAGQPSEALELLAAIDPDRVPPRLHAGLALRAVDAHLQLAEWDAAERVLDGYPSHTWDASGRALRQNARARIRLGRGDARGALRVLADIDPLPDDVRPTIERTRALAQSQPQ